MNITVLGEAKFESPIGHSISDSLLIPENIVIDPASTAKEELAFELAGPRSKLFFDPKHTRAGIVTCGGLCPGLNNVIRSLFPGTSLRLWSERGTWFSWRLPGFGSCKREGTRCAYMEFVNKIHKEGGTVLGTSRGPVDIPIAVDNLISWE
jgi:6-phosphofructokinase 1